MPLIDRIGIDMGAKLSVEDGLRWAAAHGLRYVDFRLDTGPEAFAAFTPARCAALRTQAENAGITLGLHTPTVCLGVTSVVVCIYECDDGKIWLPHCAVIDAALGDRCSPLPVCSTPPAGAGSAHSALAAGSGRASTVALGASRQLRTILPAGTMPCGDASRARCALGTRPCPLHLCLV